MKTERMPAERYRRFRRDLLEVCEHWRAEHPEVAERYLIPRLREQMAMLRAAYFHGEPY